MMEENDMRPGTVYLVGAGPGDPGLITLRGVERLRGADVVICDYLANETLLDHADKGAEVIHLGSHGSGRSVSQDEIMELMLDRAGQGRGAPRGRDPV